MTKRITRRLLLAGVPIVLATGATARFLLQPPSDLDLARRRTTDKALYVASIAPSVEPLTIGPMHAWMLTLRTRDGKPVTKATIAIDGGMPQHGHGLPTAPKVTRSFGDGRFQIDGMRFNMRGWWELHLDIDGPSGPDAITFNIVL